MGSFLVLLLVLCVGGPCSPPLLKSLTRRAAACGATAVWSRAPGPTATSSCSPGGVGLLAKAPWSVTSFAVDRLARWVQRARVCVGLIAGPTRIPMIGVVIYGYADSHPDRSLNDALIGDVLTWSSEQMTATIVGGDVNTTVKACKYLACAECLALTVISPFHLASTVDKNGIPSNGWALDHVIVNAPLRDMWSESAILYDVLPADHYPVKFNLALPIE